MNGMCTSYNANKINDWEKNEHNNDENSETRIIYLVSYLFN